MSANLKLDADELRRLAKFLELLTAAREETGVQVGVHTGTDVSVDGSTTIDISWDSTNERYQLDDVVGS